jgi:hemoglobin
VAVAVADIDSRADCERLVRAFYGRALADPVIGFIFTDVARLDLEAHVPRITSFWETILLGARTYSGGAFRPHAELDAKVRLRRGHFERWLWLWEQTIDEMFAGERAELAKSHARRVADAFVERLRGGPGGGGPLAAPTGAILPVVPVIVPPPVAGERSGRSAQAAARRGARP